MVIRTKALAGEYVHVDEEDPALDREVDNWRHRYDRALELSDVASLPLKNGTPPVVWRFRQWTPDEVAWLIDHETRGQGRAQRNLDAIAIALVGVDGVKDEAGKTVALERERDQARGGFLAAKREQLNALLSDDRGRAQMRLVGRLADRVWAELSPRNG